MSQPSQKRSAFTLIELLVVIGIITVLAALLIPLVMRAMRQGAMMRTQADFQTISFALDAYKQDFGDYPRLPINPATNQPYENTGAATLGKALLGPYGDGLTGNPPSVDQLDPPMWQSGVPYNPGDCVSNGGQFYVTLTTNTGQNVSNADYYTLFNPLDGADGPGFRTRRSPGPDGTFFTADDVVQGKVWGPYLAPGKIKNQGVFLLDSYSRPILYFPARPTVPNLSPSTPVTQGISYPYVDIPSATPVLALYNAGDNLQAFRREGVSNEEPPGSGTDLVVLQRIQIMFGDYNHDGVISTVATPTTPAETAVTLPFVLMSAGSDGLFGPTSLFNQTTGKDDFSDAFNNQRAVQKCDDVTNFQ